MLDLKMQYQKGILFVRIDGWLTKKTSHKITDALLPIIRKHKIKYMVYNLYELKGLDDTGAAALQDVDTAIKKNHGKLYMCEIPCEFSLPLKHLNIDQTKNELSAMELLKI